MTLAAIVAALSITLLVYPWTLESRLLPGIPDGRKDALHGQGHSQIQNSSLHFALELKRRIKPITKSFASLDTVAQHKTFSKWKRKGILSASANSSAQNVLKESAMSNDERGIKRKPPEHHGYYFTEKAKRRTSKTQYRDDNDVSTPIQKIDNDSDIIRQVKEPSETLTGKESKKLTSYSPSRETRISSNTPVSKLSAHNKSQPSFEYVYPNLDIPQTFSAVFDHRDNFRCGECVCSYNNHGLIYANCTFNCFHDFPQNIPKTVIQVNISRNSLKILNQSAIVALKKLITLSMRSNRISKIVVETCEVSQLEVLDLSYNIIEVLQDNSLSFLTNLKNLSLQSNKLMYIKNRTFANLTKLKVLNIASNKIRQFDASAFDSLIELRELYMFRNTHLGYTSRFFLPSLFNKTKKLKVLYIQGDASGQPIYPLEALAKLKNLQHINIDIVYSSEFLGPGILELKNLKILEFGPDATCHHLEIISADFFQYVPYIEVLSFYNCLFHDLDPAVYAGIPKLKKLSYCKIKTYSLFKAFTDLKGLQKSSLEYLQLRQLGTDTGIKLPCLSLNGDNAKYLKNITTLKEIDLSYNNIAILLDDFIRGLPSSLEILRLSNNVLTLNGMLLTRIYPLQNLVELDVSNQGIVTLGSERFLEDGESENVFEKEQYTTKNNTILDVGDFAVVNPAKNDLVQSYNLPFEADNVSFYGNDMRYGNHFDDEEEEKYKDTDEAYDNHDDNEYYSSCDDNGGSSSLTLVKDRDRQISVASRDSYFRQHPLPRSLKIVRASRYAFVGHFLLHSNYYIAHHNNIHYLGLANSVLTHWGSGTLFGSSIKYIDLSENYCQHLNRMFFIPNNSVVTISLRSNLLGNEFSTLHGGHFFTYLNKTKYLDISLNFIYKLPNTFLRGLTSLETLRMTDNRLQTLNLSFLETPNLRMLDVRQNSISWFSKQSRHELDQIAMRHPVTLAIVNNPISCTCGAIDIVKWMAMTHVHLLDRELLKCRDDNGRILSMGDISLLHKSLQRRCAATSNIIISCSVSISFFTFIVMGYCIGKRYRWWFYVRYKKNVFFARWFGFKPKMKERPTKEYRYDAYLCYAAEDRKLAIAIANKLDNTHSLFIPDRDILYGTSEVSGMTSGVINSYKFLIVLTEEFKELLSTDFQNNGMLEYTIFTALFEEKSSRRQMLHVMQFADVSVQDEDIPVYLAHVLGDRNRQTTFPLDDSHASPEALNCVWDSLSDSIRQQKRGEGTDSMCLSESYLS